MSLKAFLYACEAMVFQSPRFHVETPAEMPAGDVAARNDQAMQALMGRMGTVQKKGRKG